MQIKIPHHNIAASLSDIRTIDLIKAIFATSQCTPYIKDGPERTKLFVGERLLETGRIHLKAYTEGIRPYGHYVVDVHFDSEQHRKKPRGIVNGKSTCLLDCFEVRKFANKFVIPIILKNRKYYRYRISESDNWWTQSTLLDEKTDIKLGLVDDN
jgi:hypothetical protein